jgi:hypothetical protein
LALAYQDFRYRAISWFWLPILFMLLAYNHIKNTSYELVIDNFLLNISFLIFQMGALTLYFSFKNKRFVNVINTYLGLGDVLFFVVLSVGLSCFNYIFFRCFL